MASGNASNDVHNRGAGGTTFITPPSAGLASNVLPEANTNKFGTSSNTGVSTRNALSEQHWFVLRSTYGREKKAYEHLVKNGVECFYPTILTKKTIRGKRKFVEESRLPNIFFAYGTFDEIKEFVYDNIHEDTKHLRFYYNSFHNGTKEPLIVPERQMRSLKIICSSGIDDVLLCGNIIEKFRKGQHVIIQEGAFAGVEGIVARFCGHQRVGIVINGGFTATTAYIPKAFIKVINQTDKR